MPLVSTPGSALATSEANLALAAKKSNSGRFLVCTAVCATEGEGLDEGLRLLLLLLLGWVGWRRAFDGAGKELGLGKESKTDALDKSAANLSTELGVGASTLRTSAFLASGEAETPFVAIDCKGLETLCGDIALGPVGGGSPLPVVEVELVAGAGLAGVVAGLLDMAEGAVGGLAAWTGRGFTSCVAAELKGAELSDC